MSDDVAVDRNFEFCFYLDFVTRSASVQQLTSAGRAQFANVLLGGEHVLAIAAKLDWHLGRLVGSVGCGGVVTRAGKEFGTVAVTGCLNQV